MAVRHTPRDPHAIAGDEAWGDPLDELEALFWSFEPIPGHRVELLEGQIVVSPLAVFWHGQVVAWLLQQFRDVCEANGWEQAPGCDLVLPPTRDIAEPDHVVARDPGQFSNLEPEVPVEHMLLVSEVVSPSSKRADREVKRLSYAKAGIPFYLLVDRLAEPFTITLFSGPSADGYARADAVVAGPGGGALHIPEPFGMTLDATTLPIPRGNAK